MSLLLSDETVRRPSPAAGKPAVLRSDKATLLAMPYKQQRRIGDMFAANRAAASSSATSSSAGRSSSAAAEREDADLKRALEMSNREVSGRASGAASKQQPAAKKPKMKKGQRGIQSFFGGGT